MAARRETGRATRRATGRRRAWLVRYPEPLSAHVSRGMRGNRRVGTQPEAEVRSLLHRAGLRFRRDFPVRLPRGQARPDIAFTRLHVAIFIDGCFWHACPRHGTTPVHNAWYWAPKLARNRERDRQATAALRRQGWLVRRFWEHEPADVVAQKVRALVERVRG